MFVVVVREDARDELVNNHRPDHGSVSTEEHIEVMNWTVQSP